MFDIQNATDLQIILISIAHRRLTSQTWRANDTPALVKALVHLAILCFEIVESRKNRRVRDGIAGSLRRCDPSMFSVLMVRSI